VSIAYAALLALLGSFSFAFSVSSAESCNAFVELAGFRRFLPLDKILGWAGKARTFSPPGAERGCGKGRSRARTVTAAAKQACGKTNRGRQKHKIFGDIDASAAEKFASGAAHLGKSAEQRGKKSAEFSEESARGGVSRRCRFSASRFRLFGRRKRSSQCRCCQ
jgi:hypothetical protein